jgi:hypothetical protein
MPITGLNRPNNGKEDDDDEIIHTILFENRVHRRIFGPNRDEVIGGWRNLHNEVFHDVCILNQILLR